MLPLPLTLVMLAPFSTPLVASAKSAASTPVTGSENVTANATLFAFVRAAEGVCRTMLSTLGDTVSIATAILEAGRPVAEFPATSLMVGVEAITRVSVPTPVPLSTWTKYSPGVAVGNTLVIPEPVRLPVRVRLKLSKPPFGSVSIPSTASLKLTVNCSVGEFVGPAVGAAIETVGAVASTVNVVVGSATRAFPARSITPASVEFNVKT